MAITFRRIDRPRYQVLTEMELDQTPRVILGEASVIWLEDPARFPYVREGWQPFSSRQRGPGRTGQTGRVVAYATLEPDEPGLYPGRFDRRIWWVMPHDASECVGGVYAAGAGPMEAVVPASVRPGQCSEGYGSPGCRFCPRARPSCRQASG